MYDILDSFNTEADFYEMNPQLFRFKPTPSNVMWAIALLELPKSKYASFRLADRKLLIASDFLHDDKFNWDSYAFVIKEFTNFALTDKQMLLRTWRNKLHERNTYLEETPYDDSSADSLDKILGNTPRLWDQLRKCEKDVLDEEEVRTLGGAQPSLKEQGLI